MTDLEKVWEWISTYPKTESLRSIRIDYYDPRGDNSIGPAGLTEISRTEDLFGNITVENRYSFGLYYVLAEETTDLANIQWVLDFQKWVQEQSLQHLAPIFGDEPKTEHIAAQNGALYATDEDGTATYMLQLTINFKKFYEVN